MSMRRILALPVIAALLIVVIPRPASACSCVVPNLADVVGQAGAVFIGTQITVEPEDGDGFGLPTVLTVAVHEVFKGDIGSTVELHTADNSAACGIQYSTEQPSGIVAFSNGDGDLSVNLCSSGWAADEIRAFYDGSVPPMPPDTTMGTTTTPPTTTVPPTTVPPTTVPPTTVPPTTPPSTIGPPPSTTVAGDSSTTTVAAGPLLPGDGQSLSGGGPESPPERSSQSVGGPSIAAAAAVVALAGAAIGLAAASGRVS